MSITTCQKVTLISCSVLCISLFLPRMLLPRGNREMGQPEVGPGFYPPVTHQLQFPKDDPDQWGVEPSYSIIQSVEAMARVKGVGRGKKYNLMAQVIPIYGFGILLYIIYIMYKLTCKGKANPSGNCAAVNKANKENTTLNDHELVRLQQRLLQTERMMEKIASRKGQSSGKRRKSKNTPTKKEEKLLKQLKEITQLMQESRLEGASPEMEAEEVPYFADWEGYPEETYPQYDEACDRHRYEPIMLEVPIGQPTAEALAERMMQEEEEVMARRLSIVQEEEEDEEAEKAGEDKEENQEEEDETEMEEVDEEMEEVLELEEEDEEDEEDEEGVAETRKLLSHSSPQFVALGKQEWLGLEVSKELQRRRGGRKQITFSEHRDVFHYPKEGTYEGEEEEEDEETDEEEEEEEQQPVLESTTEEEEGDEEDPVMEAESLQFICETRPNPEAEAEEGEEEYLLMLASVEEDACVQADLPKEVGVSGLRMRNRRET